MKSNRLPFLALLLFLLFHGNIALACPVCYGETEGTGPGAVNAAVIVLLGFTGTVLALFSALFLRIRKRIRMMSDNSRDFTNLN